MVFPTSRQSLRDAFSMQLNAGLNPWRIEL
jgi:hypothetical protein